MRGRHAMHTLHFSITISRVPLQPYHSKCAPCLCSSLSMPNENVGFLYAPPCSRRSLGFILPTLTFPAHNLSCPSGIALPVQDFLLIPLLSLFRCFLKSFLSFFKMPVLLRSLSSPIGIVKLTRFLKEESSQGGARCLIPLFDNQGVNVLSLTI